MLHVVVGVVIDDQHNVLVAQRHVHADHGGFWEFPGGKVETDESAYAALCREFQEEVHLEILSGEPFIKIEHQYPKYSLLLDVWKITRFKGEVKGAEGQLIRWIPLSELPQFPMPEANRGIVDRLSIEL